MTSPLMFVQETLAADAELPTIYAHIFRGQPKDAAIVLVGLGGEGISGVSFSPRRNIDSIRIEARAPSMMAAEATLDRAVTILQQRTNRLVSVEGTASDYDAATEVFRAFSTLDIRR